MDTEDRSGPLAPWRLEPGAPADHGTGDRTPDERLRALLPYAVLAPSGHNTQPWRFCVRDGVLEVRADPTRRLEVVDPEDRELVISCGAALFHIRAAAQFHGDPVVVDLLPDGSQPDLLARVRVGDGDSQIPDVEQLVRAVPRRRTNRGSFEDRPVPEALVRRLHDDVAAEGAQVVLSADPEVKRRVADLVAEGDRRQMADPRFRRELAAWLRDNRSDARDGIRGYGFGFGNVLSHVGPLVIRTFDLGKGQAAKDHDVAVGSPVLALLTTVGDDRREWLHAGQALARMLLRARAHDLWASYLNQPVEVDALRGNLAAAFSSDRHPQLLLRLGYGSPPMPQPRRPAAEVLAT